MQLRRMLSLVARIDGMGPTEMRELDDLSKAANRAMRAEPDGEVARALAERFPAEAEATP